MQSRTSYWQQRKLQKRWLVVYLPPNPSDFRRCTCSPGRPGLLCMGCPCTLQRTIWGFSLIMEQLSRHLPSWVKWVLPPVTTISWCHWPARSSMRSRMCSLVTYRISSDRGPLSCGATGHLAKLCPGKNPALQPQPATSKSEQTKGDVPKNAHSCPGEWTEGVRRRIKVVTPPSQQNVPDKSAAKPAQKLLKQEQLQQQPTKSSDNSLSSSNNSLSSSSWNRRSCSSNKSWTNSGSRDKPGSNQRRRQELHQQQQRSEQQQSAQQQSAQQQQEEVELPQLDLCMEVQEIPPSRSSSLKSGGGRSGRRGQ